MDNQENKIDEKQSSMPRTVALSNAQNTGHSYCRQGSEAVERK